jgi:hypothetical protein
MTSVTLLPVMVQVNSYTGVGPSLHLKSLKTTPDQYCTEVAMMPMRQIILFPTHGDLLSKASAFRLREEI